MTTSKRGNKGEGKSGGAEGSSRPSFLKARGKTPTDFVDHGCRGQTNQQLTKATCARYNCQKAYMNTRIFKDTKEMCSLKTAERGVRCAGGGIQHALGGGGEGV